jgi:phage-related protein
MRKPGEHADIDFRGNSLEVLSSFPLPVKETLGFNLRRLQNGEVPECAFRPMPSVGSGVFELKSQDERAWYRLMYLARVKGVIYVLHCFEKNTRKTTKRDLETARDRLKDVMAELVQERARLKKGERHGNH